MRKILLAVLAGMGVLAAGCTSTQQSHELSDLADGEVFMGADVESYASEATGLIVFDMPEGKSGWIYVTLPLPHATDGTDACELPTLDKYSTFLPAGAAGGPTLHITRTKVGFNVSLEPDGKTYVARMDDYTSTTQYRFTRGMPYSFRPCPPWAK